MQDTEGRRILLLALFLVTAAQIVHTNLVAVLLDVTSREVASITTSSRRATATSLVAAGRLLSLGSLSSLGFGSNLIESLGSLVGFLGNPVGPAKIHNIQQHELESAGKFGEIHHSLDTVEVGVHHGATLLGTIEVRTDGPEQLAERLNFSLIGNSLIVDEFLHTLMHDTLSKHAELVQLTDKLNKTETTSLGSGSSVVLV
ncbi:hypothetical protein HG530_014125 [Fusarium avenaceum]|nr:hypothetical protein HG530_014125 [Fusarium avenaceum]